MQYIHIKSSFTIPTALRYTHNWSSEYETECSKSRNKYFKYFVNDSCRQLKAGKECYVLTNDMQIRKEQLRAIKKKCKFNVDVIDLHNGYYLLKKGVIK